MQTIDCGIDGVEGECLLSTPYTWAVRNVEPAVQFNPRELGERCGQGAEVRRIPWPAPSRRPWLA